MSFQVGAPGRARGGWGRERLFRVPLRDRGPFPGRVGKGGACSPYRRGSYRRSDHRRKKRSGFRVPGEPDLPESGRRRGPFETRWISVSALPRRRFRSGHRSPAVSLWLSVVARPQGELEAFAGFSPGAMPTGGGRDFRGRGVPACPGGVHPPSMPEKTVPSGTPGSRRRRPRRGMSPGEGTLHPTRPGLRRRGRVREKRNSPVTVLHPTRPVLRLLHRCLIMDHEWRSGGGGRRRRRRGGLGRGGRAPAGAVFVP